MSKSSKNPRFLAKIIPLMLGFGSGIFACMVSYNGIVGLGEYF